MRIKTTDISELDKLFVGLTQREGSVSCELQVMSGLSAWNNKTYRYRTLGDYQVILSRGFQIVDGTPYSLLRGLDISRANQDGGWRRETVTLFPI